MPSSSSSTAKRQPRKKAGKVREGSGNPAGVIRIRGASVNNLQGIDVDIPRDALTVITGVSGSGKSSLAFDTLYAEGQRQYIDSLSAYARQYLDQMPRPDVDLIDGLAPTLAIDQKPGSSSARSTVATVTEIYDFLRLLFARVGTAHCVQCGSEVAQQSATEIGESLCALPEGSKLVLMAPMVRGRRGAHRDVLKSIQDAGLIRARVDGETYLIEEVPALAPRKNHTIEAVVDRLVIRDGIESRLAESLELALRLGKGLVSTQLLGQETPMESLYNTAMACGDCGTSFEELEPRTFSFNSPYGACSECQGLGLVESGTKGELECCQDCEGGRLRPEALAVTIRGLSIADLVDLPIRDSLDWFETLAKHLGSGGQAIASPIIREVVRRMNFLCRVGVPYLALSRRSDSLSGGELQRVRLATNIGSGLVGVCYVLDEPSIGLHPADHDQLLACIRDLQRAGNTVVVVEHDSATMEASDHLIDIGPGAGSQGGRLVSQGTPDQVKADSNSSTGQFLSGARTVSQPASWRRPTGHLQLSGVTTNNLKNVSVQIPLGCLVGVTGVSGSGKSSLINGTLYPVLAKKLDLVAPKPGPYKKITGWDAIDKLIPIDQTPIGRSPRSCPATYSGVLDEIRKVYARTRQAKTLGYKAGRFSFNSAQGRCDQCKGHGVERIEMNFLSDLFVTCTRCGGRRFNRQTLQVRFKGASIADVLNQSVNEAVEFFENVPPVHRILSSLQAVGLGYIHLGQSSTTVSGGEAQRIKLATELSRKATGRTLYLLDEPTTGLHFEDVDRLVKVLQRLVDGGNTVLVIEHNMDLIRCCDQLIDIGPGGGEHGGQIVACGNPAEVAASPESKTGRFLNL